MIRNVSNDEKKITNEIIKVVGKPFSFSERLRMKGNLSPRLTITRSSLAISKIMEQEGSLDYCNIEIRPKGIILGFPGSLESYAWVIPFHKVSIYKTETGYSVFSDEQFVEITSQTTKATHSFFNRLIEKRVLHHNDYAFNEY